MRPKPVYVVDLIRQVATNTNTAVIAELKVAKPSITGINFIPGTADEINEVLIIQSQQDNTGMAGWPLFALLMSFKEDKAQTTGDTKRGIGIDGIEDLNILIAMRSNATDKTPARYTNIFKPILYPIYLEFLNQLYLSPYFDTQLANNIPHTKIDFPYYNAEKDTNIFGNYVDAIQIKLKLKIRLPNGQY